LCATGALRQRGALPAGGANPYFCGVIQKPNLKRLAAAVRAAEVELDAAKDRTSTNEAAKKLMRAREALKAAENEIKGARAPGRPFRCLAS
jgi:uncharacterized protein YhaN